MPFLCVRRKLQLGPAAVEDDELALEEDVAVDGEAEPLVRLQAAETVLKVMVSCVFRSGDQKDGEELKGVCGK